MIHVDFIGRIGKGGAEVKTGKNGNDYVVMNVATDDFSNGEEKTVWVRVASSQSNHLNLAQYLTQGKPISVHGRLRAGAWLDKDGNPRSSIDVTAERIDFLPGRKKDENNEQSQKEAATAPVPPKKESKSKKAKEDEDDLPF